MEKYENYRMEEFVDLKGTSTALTVLLMAAFLETGGDALIRTGLSASNPFLRTALFTPLTPKACLTELRSRRSEFRSPSIHFGTASMLFRTASMLFGTALMLFRTAS